MARQIRVELLPHERAALLQRNFTSDEVRNQLKVCTSISDVETFTFTATDLRWLASDLTHAIVKRGCRDQDIVELSERLDYIDETSDGTLDRGCRTMRSS